MHLDSRTSAVLKRLAALTLVALVQAGCESDPAEPLLATSLFEVSGNHQTVPRGGAESDPLVVGVLDQNASPLAAVVVEWSVSEGDGSLTTTSSTSDSSGHASVVYLSGSAPGDVVVTATVSGLEPVSFTLSVSAEELPQGEEG